MPEAPSPPATPRETAQAFVRPSVARGDPLGWYAGHILGDRCAAAEASIGPPTTPTGEQRDSTGDRMTVTSLGGQPCHAIFPLLAIWDEVEAELHCGRRQRRLC